MTKIQNLDRVLIMCNELYFVSTDSPFVFDIFIKTNLLTVLQCNNPNYLINYDKRMLRLEQYNYICFNLYKILYVRYWESHYYLALKGHPEYQFKSKKSFKVQPITFKCVIDFIF